MGGTDDAEHRETLPPDWGHIRWRAEDLLRAAVAAEGSDTDPDLDGGVESRIHRFLDQMDDHVVTFRSGHDERTYSISGQSRGDGQTGWPDTPPIQIPHHDLLACIGVGGFGQVWLARHHLTDHFRACKLIPASRAIELEGLKRLKQRVPTHPNLFPIDDVGHAGDWLFVLMPLADAVADGRGSSPAESRVNITAYRTLSLRHRLQDGDRLAEAEVARIAADLLDGMAHLHSHGVVHGDIKPGNCLRLGGRWTLADYGMLQDSDSQSGSGYTPGYVPPEGPGTTDADLYAFGVVLTRMLDPVSPGTRKTRSRRHLARLARRLIDPNPRVRREAQKAAWKVFRRLLDRRAAVRRNLVVLGVLLTASSAAVIAMMLIRPAPVAPAPPPSASAEQINRMWDNLRRLEQDITTSRGSVSSVGNIETEPEEASAARAIRERSGFIFSPKILPTRDLVYAITEDGRVIQWGQRDERMPAIPDNIVDPVHIASNGPSVVVIQADGTLVSWGYDEDREPERTAPDDLPPVVDVDMLFQRATIAVLADGTVRGWGKNWSCAGPEFGLLENIDALNNIVSVNGENGHWVYTTDTGLAGGRGCGWSGQLSFPTLDEPPIQVIAAESWTCLLDAQGRIHTFGFRADQWLRPPEGTGFVQIAATRYNALALHKSGRVVEWGDNRDGQGVVPDGLTDVVGVAAGPAYSIAFHTDGSLTMWGDNQLGQLDWPKDIRIRLGDPDLDGNGVPDWIDRLRDQSRD